MAVYDMGAGDLEISLQIAQLMAAFGGIALYNVVELLALIAVTFRRRKGLYFWSLIVATVAIVPYTLGLLFKFFGVIYITMLLIAFIDIGWQCMVTGQSFVLYSRLHLVTSTRWKIRFVLGMIILNFFVSNVPITIFIFASASSHAGPFLKPYAFWERFQLCCYCTQETIISGLYIYEISSILKPQGSSSTFPTEERKSTDRGASVSRMPTKRAVKKSPRGRKVLKHLLYVNIIIVILDVTLLATEFIGHYEIQVLYKATVYSMKLKLEFRILNQLTEIAQDKLHASQAYFSAQSESLVSPLGSSGSGGDAPLWPEKDGVQEMCSNGRYDSLATQWTTNTRIECGVTPLASTALGEASKRKATDCDVELDIEAGDKEIDWILGLPPRPSPVMRTTAPPSSMQRRSDANRFRKVSIG